MEKRHLGIILIVIFISLLKSISMQAQVNGLQTADSSVVNITGSDSVQALISDADTIRIEKKGTELYGYENGRKLTIADYKGMFIQTPAALSQIKTANALHKTGLVFTYVGSFMFGFIGAMGLQDLKSVDATWGLALGASAAVAGIGFAFYSGGNQAQRKAILIYNDSIKQKPERKEVGYLNFGLNRAGVGVSYTFR